MPARHPGVGQTELGVLAAADHVGALPQLVGAAAAVVELQGDGGADAEAAGLAVVGVVPEAAGLARLARLAIAAGLAGRTVAAGLAVVVAGGRRGVGVSGRSARSPLVEVPVVGLAVVRLTVVGLPIVRLAVVRLAVGRSAGGGPGVARAGLAGLTRLAGLTVAAVVGVGRRARLAGLTRVAGLAGLTVAAVVGVGRRAGLRAGRGARRRAGRGVVAAGAGAIARVVAGWRAAVAAGGGTLLVGRRVSALVGVAAGLPTVRRVALLRRGWGRCRVAALLGRVGGAGVLAGVRVVLRATVVVVGVPLPGAAAVARVVGHRWHSCFCGERMV